MDWLKSVEQLLVKLKLNQEPKNECVAMAGNVCLSIG